MRMNPQSVAKKELIKVKQPKRTQLDHQAGTSKMYVTTKSRWAFQLPKKPTGPWSKRTTKFPTRNSQHKRTIKRKYMTTENATNVEGNLDHTT